MLVDKLGYQFFHNMHGLKGYEGKEFTTFKHLKKWTILAVKLQFLSLFRVRRTLFASELKSFQSNFS